MHILYDNITSTLVAGTVLLILFTMQIRVMNMNAQQTATYMTKKFSLDFADWLEDDLLEIGKNIEYGEPAFENPIPGDDGVTKSFTFYKDSLDYATNPPDVLRIAVRYTLEKAEKRVIDGEEVQLYTAIREETMERNPSESWTPSVWVKNGRSASLIQHFEVKMLDADGVVVANPATVDAANPDSIQQTHVKFVMVPPFQDSKGSLRAMHWGTSLLLRY